MNYGLNRLRRAPKTVHISYTFDVLTFEYVNNIEEMIA